jgi:cation:H+ antiporter
MVWILFVAGLALLVLGAGWFVESSVAIARMMGVSELVIGLTIVAAGTSMPEVATSIIASIRGERDIAVGNVVGSNNFNILAVLGIAALLVLAARARRVASSERVPVPGRWSRPRARGKRLGRP